MEEIEKRKIWLCLEMEIVVVVVVLVTVVIETMKR